MEKKRCEAAVAWQDRVPSAEWLRDMVSRNWKLSHARETDSFVT